MITLAELKQDVELSQGLGEVVDILKTAALIQFRTLQTMQGYQEEFRKELERSLSAILSLRELPHYYLMNRKQLPSILLVMTSEEGFVGELNTLLINEALNKRQSPRDEIVILGERGTRYLEDMKEIFVSFPGISDDMKYQEMEEIRDYILKKYREEYGRVLAIYPEFQSLTSQIIKSVAILPYLGKDKKQQGQNSFLIEEILIGPSPKKVLEGLIHFWLGFRLLEIFRSAKQSEVAARIMHLEGSTQELSFLNQKLSLAYFRQVHNLSDKTIRELSGAKILLGKRSTR